MLRKNIGHHADFNDKKPQGVYFCGISEYNS